MDLNPSCLAPKSLLETIPLGTSGGPGAEASWQREHVRASCLIPWTLLRKLSPPPQPSQGWVPVPGCQESLGMEQGPKHSCRQEDTHALRKPHPQPSHPFLGMGVRKGAGPGSEGCGQAWPTGGGLWVLTPGRPPVYLPSHPG